ncbi:metallophosphoesterase family protein [Pacificimonas flava]|uniref:DNA repair exonuclease family protein YhaO n=1 Tax=Pacificimonas flava TaxID=1234595 RepID=M2S970_9SPHN|nr:DNA repair exonuclease [Pacificimonas flava]EMD81920.1 DNA repair exonuclease family protein YhaO [Pacificimonas flava]MBB5281548.1 DNA repair exonuclease SbcCD nuclease subunit [Pacificimonas flava]
MASFRFLHAADIHLDSPLKGLTGQDGIAAERVRCATREAFDRLVSVAIEEKVSFLIIAGDLYDGDWRDYKTGLFFAAQMGRLNAANIPVYLLHGNHDAESQITKRLDLPGNVHVFGTHAPETFRLGELGVALHGHSFRQRDVTDNLVPHYPGPVNGAFNIGVLHTACGLGGHENYAPCSLNDLVNKGYDYWALGHVHQATVLHERPHVVFPGNLQGRHVRETGAKGACLVTVSDREVVEFEAMPCDVVRWAVLPVSLAGASAMGEVIDRVRDALETAVANGSEGRLLACRIVLEGRTEVHAQLVSSGEQLLADARASALGLGDEVAWVEKVTMATEATLNPEALAQREDAIGELQRMLQDAKSDADLLAQIEGDIGELVRRLPHEVRTEIEDDVLKSAIAGDYDTLIRDVAPYLSARLIAGEA